MAEHDSAGEQGSRLIYGIVRGRRTSPVRRAIAIAAARQADMLMARSGLVRPVLLVSGFWRSGTTWVQEVMAETLGAKTVFEPLSPQEPAWRALRPAAMPPDEDTLQATIPGPTTDQAFWSYLDRTVSGRHTSPFLMSCRRTAFESVRRAVVIKDVRLQCNLGAFHHRFGVPVLHVRRHPCAVVASLIAADWHWSFARLHLADLLDAVGETAMDQSTIAHFDRDMPSRIAAYWAVTERIAEQALAGQRWGGLVHYEALAADPGATIADTCAMLDLRQARPVDATRPSASVHPAAFAAYGAVPQERWRKLLAPDVIDRIHAAADAFHPAWRLGGGA